MQRGKLLLAALGIIKHFSIGVVEMMDIMTSGYGESYKKLKGFKPAAPYATKIIKELFDTLEKDIEKDRQNKDLAAKRKIMAQKLIYRLKRDKLVVENDKSGNRSLNLSEKGENKYATLDLRLSKQRRYRSEKSDQVIIVAFDVPEQERWKRGWLRNALKIMGLNFIQRSLWAGKIKLPLEFIDDLERFGLASYVEIFAVTKAGSLKKMML